MAEASRPFVPNAGIPARIIDHSLVWRGPDDYSGTVMVELPGGVTVELDMQALFRGRWDGAAPTPEAWATLGGAWIEAAADAAA